MSNGSESMKSDNKPDTVNNLVAVRKQVAQRKAENINSLGNSNGSTGGNIAVGGN